MGIRARYLGIRTMFLFNTSRFDLSELNALLAIASRPYDPERSFDLSQVCVKIKNSQSHYLRTEERMESIWTCAQTHPTEEPLALRHLKNQKYNAFFPIFLHTTRRGQQRSRPLFPGYIFIEIRADQIWMPINNTHGVNRLLTRWEGEYLTPQPLPDWFIDSLSNFVVPSDLAYGSSLNPGMKARVKQGIFAEHEAFINWREGARLKLLFDIMGREVQVEFHISEVDPV
jgi:transcriptional antiterminator RfaH